MPKQVLFVQGGGEGTHDEWDNKLVASLERELGSDYEIRYPRMPDEGSPQYGSWKVALQTEFGKLRDGAILIGHSIGGTILIAALAEHTAKWMPAANGLRCRRGHGTTAGRAYFNPNPRLPPLPSREIFPEATWQK